MGVYVIAEAGSTHDGMLHRALECIGIAKQCGADAVKFQYWSDGKALAARRNAPEYGDVYNAFAIPESWLPVLADEADLRGIDFMCTAYLPQDVAVVATYVDHFKVASFESGARDVLEAHRPFLSTNSPRTIMISLGLGADGKEAEACLGDLLSCVRFLHCISAYPAPIEDMDLLRLHARWRTDPTSQVSWRYAGLSDHSLSATVAAAAVGAGAQYIETHMRLDATSKENPDYACSLNPEKLADYIAQIRVAEKATAGVGLQAVMPSEEPLKHLKVGGTDGADVETN